MILDETKKAIGDFIARQPLQWLLPDGRLTHNERQARVEFAKNHALPAAEAMFSGNFELMADAYPHLNRADYTRLVSGDFDSIPHTSIDQAAR